jgi:hypothetical protein
MEKKARVAWRGDLQDGISVEAQRAVASVCCAINKQFSLFAGKVNDGGPIPAVLNARISLRARLVP